jgi:hypothetical protein
MLATKKWTVMHENGLEWTRMEEKDKAFLN